MLAVAASSHRILDVLACKNASCALESGKATPVAHWSVEIRAAPTGLSASMITAAALILPPIIFTPWAIRAMPEPTIVSIAARPINTYASVCPMARTAPPRGRIMLVSNAPKLWILALSSRSLSSCWASCRSSSSSLSLASFGSAAGSVGIVSSSALTASAGAGAAADSALAMGCGVATVLDFLDALVGLASASAPSSWAPLPEAAATSCSFTVASCFFSMASSSSSGSISALPPPAAVSDFGWSGTVPEEMKLRRGEISSASDAFSIGLFFLDDVVMLPISSLSSAAASFACIAWSAMLSVCWSLADAALLS